MTTGADNDTELNELDALVRAELDEHERKTRRRAKQVVQGDRVSLRGNVVYPHGWTQDTDPFAARLKHFGQESGEQLDADAGYAFLLWTASWLRTRSDARALLECLNAAVLGNDDKADPTVADPAESKVPSEPQSDPNAAPAETAIGEAPPAKDDFGNSDEAAGKDHDASEESPNA